MESAGNILGRKKFEISGPDEKEKSEKKDFPIWIYQKYWRKGLKGLTPLERCILISIEFWGKMHPNKSTLAKELEVARNTIYLAVESLKKKGFKVELKKSRIVWKSHTS